MDSRRDRHVVRSFKELKLLPINLRRKNIREARILTGRYYRRRPAKQKVITVYQQNDFDRAEHNAMLTASYQELQQILMDCEVLSDIPFHITPAELSGQIAISQRRYTMVNVQRDGLSTLKIVLPQSSPTIAQLKKAIAQISLAQQKRQNFERRRALYEAADGPADDPPEDSNRQQVVKPTTSTSTTAGSSKAVTRSTGELVYSEQRNGHEHRPLVSWRFLWRCFALFNVDTNRLINDNDDNGRATLTELGIENGTNLKFVHRVKYFGRRRQK